MSDATANFRIDLSGSAMEAILHMQKDFQSLIQRASVFENETKQAFDVLTSKVTKFGFGLRQLSFSAIADNVRNVTDAFMSTAAPGLEFEQNIADLQAITGIAGDDLKNLSEHAREVGQSSGLGASKAVEAFKLLASNIDITTIGGVEGLKELQNATITLSKASGTDLPTAANTMSFALNQFQLPASEAARVINTLGAGAKFGAAEIPDLSESLKNAGATAAQAGLSIEQTTGAIEVLSQRGLKGSEAGTALRNVILKLQTDLNIDLRKTGLSKALDSLKSSLNDTVYLEKIFGRENINAAQILISSAGAVEEMTNRVTDTQVAFEQAAIRSKTYQHELEIIRARIENLKIGFFEATGSFLPWSEALMQTLIPLSQMVPLFSLVTSGIKILTTAQWALNAAQMAMPVLAIVAGLALIGSAIYSLTKKYDGASIAADDYKKAQQQVKESTFDEKYETERLIKVAGDATRGIEERTGALDKLKAKSKEFFGQLTLETIATEKGAKAFNDYAASIEKVALAELIREKVKERVRAQEDIRQNGPSHSMSQWLAKYQKLAYNSVIGAMLYGPAGIAKASVITALDEQNLALSQINELSKANDIDQNRLYNLESGYNVPKVPLVLSPSASASQSPSKTRGISIGRQEFNIEIKTDNLDKSKNQIKEWVRETIYQGLNDSSNAIPSY